MSGAPPTLVRRLTAAFGTGRAARFSFGPLAPGRPTAAPLLLLSLAGLVAVAEARAQAPPEQALDAAIAAVRAEIEAARADAGASGALMRELESTRARLNEATAELAAARGRLRALAAERASGVELAEATAGVRRERDEAVRRNADLVAQLDQAETLVAEARSAVLPAREDLARLTAERDDARREAAALAEESRGLRDRVARLERVAAASTDEIRDVGGQLVQALTRSRDLTRALAQVQSERDAFDQALDAGGGMALASDTPADDPGAEDSGTEDWAAEEPTPVGVEAAAAAKLGPVAEPEPPGYAAGGYAGEDGGLVSEAPATPVAAVYPLPADAPGLRTSVTREGRVTLVPEDLDFVEGGVELAPGTEAGLGAVAALLRRYPGRRVLVRGHTDSVGDAPDNIALARDRAERIRSVLMADFGIDGGSIATEGRGEEEPVASNLTSAGRRANRRVEIVIGG